MELKMVFLRVIVIYYEKLNTMFKDNYIVEIALKF